MKILFDTNIIIDIILKRTPFFQNSSKVFELIGTQNIKGFITASSLTDIYYISRKKTDHRTTISFITSLIQTVDVINTNKDTIILALHTDFADFEDAVQAASAELNHIDLIISRNTKDFSKSKVKALTPTEFIEKYNK